MVDDRLDALKEMDIPPPSQEARQAALIAARAAFEESRKKPSPAVQGSALWDRLTSTFNQLNGKWIMEHRLMIGTAAVCTLAIPLALVQFVQQPPLPAAPPAPDVAQVGQTDKDAVAKVDAQVEPSRPPESGELKSKSEARVAPPREENEAAPPTVGRGSSLSADSLSKRSDNGSVRLSAPTFDDTPARSAGAREAFKPNMPTVTYLNEQQHRRAPGDSRQAAGEMHLQAPQSQDRFARFEDNGQKAVASEPVSTFSIDVDTASYAFVRKMLNQGRLPDRNAVRVEELINYFSYDYPAAEDARQPFRPTVAVYPTPWNGKTQLLHIGLKGYVPPAEERKPANLVFLIDVSGSMNAPDKLPLLRSAFALLVDKLDENDTVSIVTYAGNAGTLLEPTSAAQKATILAAIDALRPGGSTAGAAGIRQAYALAQRAYQGTGVNRVILATDGDFNVGISSPGQLKDYIAQQRKSGIFLSVLGFGQGNYNDTLMQTLAQNGNGNAAYIDSLREARKVLVEQAGSTFNTIAKDVKIQIEFNPAAVSEYRLIGYETRALARADFNNDRVDAGDIGAGHTVTAIYEITPVGSGGELIDPLRYGGGSRISVPGGNAGEELAFLKMRYKLPDEDNSQLIERPITPADVTRQFGTVSADIRFAAAVAAFGQKLRASDRLSDFSYDAILAIANGSKGPDTFGYRAEFTNLVRLADSLTR